MPYSHSMQSLRITQYPQTAAGGAATTPPPGRLQPMGIVWSFALLLAGHLLAYLKARL